MITQTSPCGEVRLNFSVLHSSTSLHILRLNISNCVATLCVAVERRMTLNATAPWSALYNAEDGNPLELGCIWPTGQPG